MVRKSSSRAHAAMLANQFVGVAGDSAPADVATPGRPPREASKVLADIAEIQALLDRYNAKFETHPPPRIAAEHRNVTA